MNFLDSWNLNTFRKVPENVSSHVWRGLYTDCEALWLYTEQTIGNGQLE